MHYWADLQSVHDFCCYDNIHVCNLITLYTANTYSAEREMSVSACARSTAGECMCVRVEFDWCCSVSVQRSSSCAMDSPSEVTEQVLAVSYSVIMFKIVAH